MITASLITVIIKLYQLGANNVLKLDFSTEFPRQPTEIVRINLPTTDKTPIRPSMLPPLGNILEICSMGMSCPLLLTQAQNFVHPSGLARV